MTKSELRKLIVEILEDVLPVYVDSRLTNITSNIVSELRAQTISTVDSETLRKHLKEAIAGETTYDNIPTPVVRTKNIPSRNVPPPKNEKAIVDGEVYASGKNLLEWFKKTGGPLPPSEPEFKYSEEEISDYIGTILGKK